MKRISLILILVIALSGCTDFLSVDQKGKVVPKTIQDYSRLLKDFNTFAGSTIDAYLMTDQIKIYADEVSRIPWFSKPYVNAYLFEDYIFEGLKAKDPDWINFYGQIYICNVVLTNIENATGTNEALRKRTKGEALAQRAYAYFMLANLYAKHYNPSTADTDLAVPLMLKPDINAQKQRATVQEVYDMIEHDLLNAVELLSEEVEYNYHPMKAGVYGLLARMYMYMEKWEKARTYANKTLQYNDFLYDYKNYDFIPNAPALVGLAGFPKQGIRNKECIWFKKSPLTFIYQVAVYMTEEHKALYDEGDRRLYFRLINSFYFGSNAHGPVIFVKEFYYKAGVTVPSVMLIQAEANARLGNAPAAVETLNRLRKNRFNEGEFTPYSISIPADSALTLVLKERKIELFFNPSRLFDMKRLDRFDGVTHHFGGKTVTIGPNDPNLVLPIPKKVMNMNSLLKQNPRAGR